MLDKYKNIVIEVSLNPKTLNELQTLGHSPIMDCADNIYLVHIYSQANVEHGDIPLEGGTYPLDTQKLKEQVFAKMDELQKKMIPTGCRAKIYRKCFFDRNVKLNAIEYLKEVRADLVIAATRGEQGVEGMFADSFSDWLVEQSPCDVYIIRPKVI